MSAYWSAARVRIRTRGNPRGGERYLAGRRYGPRPDGAVRTGRGRERRGRGGTRRRPSPATTPTPESYDPAIAPTAKRTASSPSPSAKTIATRASRAFALGTPALLRRVGAARDCERQSPVTYRESPRRQAERSRHERARHRSCRVDPRPGSYPRSEVSDTTNRGPTGRRLYRPARRRMAIGPGICGTRPLPSPL